MVLAMLKSERDVARSNQLSVRFTEAERSRLGKIAARHKVKAATLARTLILAGLDDLER
jgi:hypothetical protein